MAKNLLTKPNGKTWQPHPATRLSGSRSTHATDGRGEPTVGHGPASGNRRATQPRKRTMTGMPIHVSAPRCDKGRARNSNRDQRDRFDKDTNLDVVNEHAIDAAIARHAVQAADTSGDFEEESERSQEPYEVQDPQLEGLARRLQECKMEKGIAKANREWLDGPFCEWNENLCNHVHSMSESHALAICVAMADMLSPRDALIMSLVGTKNAKIGVKAMLDLAAEPHDPSNVIRLYRLLDAAFNDADASPDFERCRCGIDMLVDMARLVYGRFEVQPLTVAAYGSWWLGSDDALDYACEALCLDDQCTLAHIVCSAINQDLHPAWRM